MPDQMTIYHEHADQYDALTAHEDYRTATSFPRSRPSDRSITPTWSSGARAPGGSRCWSRPYARSIIAGDRIAHMLDRAAAKLRSFDRLRWHVAVVDHRHVPRPDRCGRSRPRGLDAALSARHPTSETGSTPTSRSVLAEMQRVLRPGGTIIIIETLGTGVTTPQIVSPSWSPTISSFSKTNYGFQQHVDPHRLSIRFGG